MQSIVRGSYTFCEISYMLLNEDCYCIFVTAITTYLLQDTHFMAGELLQAWHKSHSRGETPLVRQTRGEISRNLFEAASHCPTAHEVVVGSLRDRYSLYGRRLKRRYPSLIGMLRRSGDLTPQS